MRNCSLHLWGKATFLFLAVCLWAFPAWQCHGDDLSWTGTISTDWFNSGNWNPAQLPTVDDVVWIEDGAPDPDVVISADDAFCGGIVLGDGVTLMVDMGYTLHVIGEGDLDGDGVSDLEEYAVTVADSYSFDVDMDGKPNYADDDSDGDGSLDECEFFWISEYGADPLFVSSMHPYEPGSVTDDADLDEATNADECAAGTSPIDDEDFPAALPAYTLQGLFVALVIVILIAFWAFRKGGRWAHLGLALILAGIGVGVSGFMVFSKTFAVGYVNFSLGETLEAAVAGIIANDTIEINGGSNRPWNGATTFVASSYDVTLQAAGGAVYLGGMRAIIEVRVQGQGKISVANVWSDALLHPALNLEVHGGTYEIECYLGERFILGAVAASPWVFYDWSGDVTGSATSVSYQAAANASIGQGNFSPPGPDLEATWYSGLPTVIKPTETLDINLFIENIGQTAVDNISWTDGIYLSRDPKLDIYDLRLDASTTPDDSLVPNDSYQQNLNMSFPDVAPGVYYLLGVADTEKEVDEYNRGNNTAAAATAALNVHLAQ